MLDAYQKGRLEAAHIARISYKCQRLSQDLKPRKIPISIAGYLLRSHSKTTSAQRKRVLLGRTLRGNKV